MRYRFIISLAVFLHLATPSAQADDVAIRAANGRFVHVGKDGVLRAEAFLPATSEAFEIVAYGKQEIALKSHDGRYVVADGKDPRLLRLAAVGFNPGGLERFQILPAVGNHFSLREHGLGVVPIFVRGEKGSAKPQAADEVVEIYRVKPLPDFLQSAVSVTVQALAAKEVAGKEYDQTRTEQTKKSIDVPDPTFKDLKRTKKVQVLATSEEYRVQAHLDGDADIRIPTMLYLGNYADGGPGMILVAIDAKLPITGHVSCKVPNVATASTGYRAKIQLAAVVAVVVQRSGNDITFGPYTVSDLHVSFASLDLSNDLLEVASAADQKVHQSRTRSRNEDRLCQSANRSLEKAMSSRAVRLPLLAYLGLP